LNKQPFLPAIAKSARVIETKDKKVAQPKRPSHNPHIVAETKR
jgi:hypothetical protein